MRAARVIRGVSVISTGRVEIRPQHVRSTGSPLFWWLLTSRRWTKPRPINVYVIEHGSGLVLFDTGQDRRSVTDAAYFPGGVVGVLYRRLARFTLREGDTLTAQLAAAGYNIADVHTVVLSHLHQDHIGGLRELGHARIVVSAAERAELSRRAAVLDGFLAEHISLPGLRWHEVAPTPLDDPLVAPFDAAHDLFGDGRLLVVPTPGHTPGSVSLLLRERGMPHMLFVGDLTYDVSLLAAEAVPGVGKRPMLLATTRLVNEYVRRNPGTLVLAAHDPAAASTVHDALRARTV
jgi:N-acyl homoserine lactone hydrolase